MGSHDVLLLDLPDDILELILLSLHSPLWVLWAASTCKRWRRIISTTGFIRRFRAIHGRRPIVACSYYNRHGILCPGHPHFQPSPYAAVVNARHFSLNFVPARSDESRWTIKDSHGSLLLLYSEEPMSRHRDLIVCEPLTRRHVVIPPPKPLVFYGSAIAVLLAADDEQGGGSSIGMSSFRVLLCSQEGVRIRACMFTSGSFYWRERSIPMPPKMLPIGFAGGRRYWHGGEKMMVVALDQSTLKFSSFVLPGDNKDRRKVSLTIDRDGKVRIVVDGQGNILKIFVTQKGGGGKGAEEWALERTIHVSAAMLGLPPQLQFFYLTWDQPEDAGMVVRIRGYGGGASRIMMRLHLDMETMEVERLPGRDMDYMKVIPIRVSMASKVACLYQ